VLLTWEDRGVEAFIRTRSRSTCQVKITGWLRGLKVAGGGSGVVSHAGVALVRVLADATGLTAGLSRAVPSPPETDLELGADRSGESSAKDRRRDVSVQDDEAHARPDRRDA
jgi:hypothetical protein